MGRIIEKGQEVFIALLESKKTGERCHSIGINEKAVALNCFTQSLQHVDEDEWHQHTEMIRLLKVQPYVFGFNMDDIEVTENHSVVHPAGSECVKRGAALVSLVSPGDTGQLLNFKVSILRSDQRRVYDSHAN
jgi:hypothetical protein